MSYDYFSWHLWIICFFSNYIYFSLIRNTIISYKKKESMLRMLYRCEDIEKKLSYVMFPSNKDCIIKDKEDGQED